MSEVNESDWAYDTETYRDIFSAGFVHAATGTRYQYEVSSRTNQSREFIAFLMWLRDNDQRLVGFNNLNFDGPVIQYLYEVYHVQGYFDAIDAHTKANEIIFGNDSFSHMIWENARIVKQVDLFKIHHFDNSARSTSLKKLEVNMRSANVVDLPYPPNKMTTWAQKQEVIDYMWNDVSETLRFYYFSIKLINFRDELKRKYPDLGDVVNFNDTKIGKKFFEMKLSSNGTQCYERVNGRRQPRQTIRDRINIGEILSPKLSFRHHEFQRVHQWFMEQSIRPDQTKGFFKGVSANVHGFDYDFGTGGIHGSLHKQAVHADNEWEIWDWDVASYYPNLAITHRFYPAHLSETFCDIYQDMFQTRREYKKGTAENVIYKFGLNGVYGDSNNVYSPFYDPQYTMGVTINGQLLLCMLAEWLSCVDGGNRGMLQNPGVQMLQINTDGLTIKIRKELIPWMNDVCAYWEQHTGLELESAQYRSMFIRDVNSYLAVDAHKPDKIKRIGAYGYETPINNPTTRERPWHADHSMLVIRRAVEAYLVDGVAISDFIMSHTDPFDFQCSVKVPRSSRLHWGQDRIQNTTRYYVSTDGKPLNKIMPPLKGKSEERTIGVEAGWNVTVTNDISNFRWDNVNWYYYINEAKKLIVT